MKKILRKALSLSLCLLFIAGISVPASAQELLTDNSITFEEFKETVEKAFIAKDCEVFIDYDPEHDYTYSDIDIILDVLENSGPTITTTHTSPLSPNYFSIYPRIMPANYLFMTNYSVAKFPYGTANFNILIAGDVDLQNDNVMHINQSTHTFSYGVNYVSDTITGGSSMSGNTVHYLYQGDVLFSYTEPNTGINISVNLPGGYMGKFVARSYLS